MCLRRPICYARRGKRLVSVAIRSVKLTFEQVMLVESVYSSYTRPARALSRPWRNFDAFCLVKLILLLSSSQRFRKWHSKRCLRPPKRKAAKRITLLLCWAEDEISQSLMRENWYLLFAWLVLVGLWCGRFCFPLLGRAAPSRSRRHRKPPE